MNSLHRYLSIACKALRDPLGWALAGLLLLALGMPSLKPLFAAAFPTLARPMYEQDSFGALLLAHVKVVALSSSVALGAGIALGVLVTRRAGREFRPLVQTVAAIGQTVPPVAVLAIAAPLIGFGEPPALVALALYGLLPVLSGTIAGIESVPAAVIDTARGMGLSDLQRLHSIELPLAAPVILAGARTSVIINIGTAALASTVGARTLGSPIIIGIAGFNQAYVLQGALLVGLLAVVADLAFARLLRQVDAWRPPH